MGEQFHLVHHILFYFHDNESLLSILTEKYRSRMTFENQVRAGYVIPIFLSRVMSMAKSMVYNALGQ